MDNTNAPTLLSNIIKNMNNPKINILYYYINIKDITAVEKHEALKRLEKIPNVTAYESMSDAEQRFVENIYIPDGTWGDINRLINDMHGISETALMIEFNGWMKERYEKLILELFDNIRLYALYTYNNSLLISEVKLNKDENEDIPIIYKAIKITDEIQIMMIKSGI